VQLYLRDDYSSVITFEQVLRGFARVPLAPGETRTVRFTLSPADLALYDRDGKWTVEPGRFTVMVGASATDLRLRSAFTLLAADGNVPEETPIKDAAIDPR
jgi:beta-glucosidase